MVPCVCPVFSMLGEGKGTIIICIVDGKILYEINNILMQQVA
jgi:hypothetical protein